MAQRAQRGALNPNSYVQQPATARARTKVIRLGKLDGPVESRKALTGNKKVTSSF